MTFANLSRNVNHQVLLYMFNDFYFLFASINFCTQNNEAWIVTFRKLKIGRIESKLQWKLNIKPQVTWI